MIGTRVTRQARETQISGLDRNNPVCYTGIVPETGHKGSSVSGKPADSNPATGRSIRPLPADAKTGQSLRSVAEKGVP